jgi:hypothetical protein
MTKANFWEHLYKIDFEHSLYVSVCFPVCNLSRKTRRPKLPYSDHIVGEAGVAASKVYSSKHAMQKRYVSDFEYPFKNKVNDTFIVLWTLQSLKACGNLKAVVNLFRPAVY